MNRFITILCIFCFCNLNGQSKFEELTDYFEDYAELSREQVYVHLNKSTFISNETIWFKTYVFSRDNNELSAQTSNLYCALLDDKDRVVKEKMIMSVNGISNGQFETDSTFTSGEYTFRAYTNYSKNFADEYTHYETKFTIINPEENRIVKPVSASNRIDLQVLPESGHLVANIKNRLGVIAKDSIGLGVSNLKVRVLENGEVLEILQLNTLGMGSIDITPNVASNYTVEYYYNNKKSQAQFPVIENKGLVINIADSSVDLTVNLRSNKALSTDVEGELYKLAIHNTVEIKTYDFIFQDKENQVFKFIKNDLFPGINIITLFDSRAQPIAERMFFNFNGLKFGKVEKPVTDSSKDSITINLPINDVDASKFQNFSVSVLPSRTKSYKKHNTIISAQLLQPFLEHSIEEAGYYFQNTDEKKKSDLDLLLLTEGWSRYNWNTIFTNAPDYDFDVEVGVSYNINSNSDNSSLYFIYPNFNTKTEIVTLEGKGSMKKSGFFPLENEDLRIGKLNKKKQLESPKLVVQFFPSKIPDFNSNFNALTSLDSYQTTNIGNEYEASVKLNKVQELKEVKVTKKKEYTRIEKLKNKQRGYIIEFDEKKRRFYRTFGQFISSYGFYVDETPSDDETGYSIFRIKTYQQTSINASQVPTIFLDDVLLVDLNILSRYSMDNIDYVEVNKSGVGEGLRGGAGVIRIYNKPIKADLKYIERDSYTSYNIPVTFSRAKEFYAPKYGSFETNFFRDYGVIDWKPRLEVKDDFVKFKVLNTDQPIKLFVEGVFNNKELISQELVID